jgi:hypothetical protein
MKKTKNTTIEVHGTVVSIISGKNGDYISLTDMLQAKDGNFFISDWLRNRNTVEFLGIWESVFNPGFNYGEFAIIKSQAGLNSYKISVSEWVKKTNAIGLKATPGRYGGTFAHPDIAFEFGMWISPEFKIYPVKEFRRLKEDENRLLPIPVIPCTASRWKASSINWSSGMVGARWGVASPSAVSDSIRASSPVLRSCAKHPGHARRSKRGSSKSN